MKHILYIILFLGIPPLTACSKTTVSATNDSAATATAAVAVSVSDTTSTDPLPNNGMCVTLRMNDATQQLIYLRTHPSVRQQPRQTVVSSPLTVITYERNDVVRHQPGKALLAGTSTAGLPTSAKATDRMKERIFFFGLPKDSHISIVTDSGLQWLDQDIKGDTYALVLTELPHGRYIVTMNSTTFQVELK